MPRYRCSAKSLLRTALAFSLLFAGCGGGTTTSPGAAPTPAPFALAGSYAGTYTGAENGTWVGTIGSDRSMTLTASSPTAGTFVSSGTVEPTGEISFRTVAGGFTITWQGRFVQSGSGVTGSGTWSSSSGFSGTWTGARR